MAKQQEKKSGGNMGIIVAVVAIVVIAGGAFYAYQSGMLNFQMQQAQGPAPQAEVEPVQQQQEEAKEQVAAPVVEKKTEPAPVKTTKYTVEEYEAKPVLCEKDSDCKIIPITCNSCDCGRAVNVYIEPYACTAEDKADPCPIALSCPAAKAVCEAGTCKKVNA